MRMRVLFAWLLPRVWVGPDCKRTAFECGRSRKTLVKHGKSLSYRLVHTVARHWHDLPPELLKNVEAGAHMVVVEPAFLEPGRQATLPRHHHSQCRVFLSERKPTCWPTIRAPCWTTSCKLQLVDSVRDVDDEGFAVLMKQSRDDSISGFGGSRVPRLPTCPKNAKARYLAFASSSPKDSSIPCRHPRGSSKSAALKGVRRTAGGPKSRTPALGAEKPGEEAEPLWPVHNEGLAQCGQNRRFLAATSGSAATGLGTLGQRQQWDCQHQTCFKQRGLHRRPQEGWTQQSNKIRPV